MSTHDCATAIELVFKGCEPRYIFAETRDGTDPEFWIKCAEAELETRERKRVYVDFWVPTPTPTLRLFSQGDLFILLEYMRKCGANVNRIRNLEPVCTMLPVREQQVLPVWRRVELEDMSLRRSEMCVRSETRMNPDMVERFDQLVTAMTDWRDCREDVVRVARILLGDVDVIFAADHNTLDDYIEFIRQERSNFIHTPIWEHNHEVLAEAIGAMEEAGAEIRYE